MKKVCTMGELLIDFVPVDNLDNTYEMKFGGAPGNVAATVSILGGDATFYGQVGLDAFGDFLKSELKQMGVNTSYVLQTNQAKTGITFVDIDKEGNRSFNFYRNPSADMLYSKEDYLEHSALEDIFAFSSVSLIDYPIKDAHLAIIEKIKNHHGLVIFDVNLRLHLWKDLTAYREMIHRFIEMSNMVKISDDELEFVTGKDNEEEGLEYLQDLGIETILYTRAYKGASIIHNGHRTDIPGFKVQTIDTTGAGDAFLGAFLYRLSIIDKEPSKWTIKDDEEILTFCNAVAALSTTKKGAVSAIPSINDVQSLIRKSKI